MSDGVEHRKPGGSNLVHDTFGVGVSRDTPDPGKRTLTEQLTPDLQTGTAVSLVQRKSSTALGDATQPVHAPAEHGITSSSSPLPYGVQIQRAFGGHDIGDIQAHTDSAAAAGAGAMGVRTFATGNHVAFTDTPDLHTAAHEAAHVVQQRGGCSSRAALARPATRTSSTPMRSRTRWYAASRRRRCSTMCQAGSNAAVQRAPAKHTTDERSHGPGPHIASATPGIDKTGFIDNGSGAPLYNRPPEAGGELVRAAPLPPTARVFVSGTYPKLSDWWYVTAYLDQTMARGYVERVRVAADLPEPLAELRQLTGGETAEGLAKEKYHEAVRDGHDLRYYENVLLYVNQQHHRKGVLGTYQDPGILGNGGNNIQLVAGHRIWLVSPEYAKTLESVVPSGSLTGGAAAKVKRFMGHLEDILKSVTESVHHLDEVAGQYAQAIRDHMASIIGITAGFITAEAISLFAAATPTGVGQAVAIVTQLALAAFGAAGMVAASIEALKHGSQWLTTAWTAKGDKDKILEASKEFLQMLVTIAVATLGYAGAKGNYRNALKIANSMPTSGLPTLATAGGHASGGAGAGAGVEIDAGVGPLGATGSMMTKHEGEGGGDKELAPEHKDAKAPTRTETEIAPKHASGGKTIPWSSKALREAEHALDEGATSVTVGSKAEAEELFAFRYANQEGGFRNTTALTGKQTRELFGSKAGTYHWDVGAKKHPHGMDHLQVHTHAGKVIRIYFP